MCLLLSGAKVHIRLEENRAGDSLAGFASTPHRSEARRTYKEL